MGPTEGCLGKLFCRENMDVKHLWIIFQILKNLKLLGPSFSDENKAKLYEINLLRKYVFQMECMRLWELAIFAITITSEGKKKV